MAEAIFRRIASELLDCSEDALRAYGIDAFSAGVAARCGHLASQEAVDILHNRGIDLSQHLSQQVTAKMLSESDYVYVMTHSHLAVLKDTTRSDLTGRIQLVTRNGRDIADPFGGGPEDYLDCADQLTAAIRQIADDLIRKDEATT